MSQAKWAYLGAIVLALVVAVMVVLAVRTVALGDGYHTVTVVAQAAAPSASDEVITLNFGHGASSIPDGLAAMGRDVALIRRTIAALGVPASAVVVTDQNLYSSQSLGTAPGVAGATYTVNVGMTITVPAGQVSSVVKAVSGDLNLLDVSTFTLYTAPGAGPGGAVGAAAYRSALAVAHSEAAALAARLGMHLGPVLAVHQLPPAASAAGSGSGGAGSGLLSLEVTYGLR
ncbi:protein of unknown function [Candidatus Hydrogenisulfobacillus filiaventi]|uniref:DUF541 domain-containing protein n=1 Tax=Candidatus Hydrogenisulfobacillus filiaventi TaxID=2707344 RepID=A0A6F8ZE48_9FIRM|nr:protein of unknown function [Candidatus Hydrogenisulfobacillus filiaventi]